jgi:hypothetical protein
MASYLDCKKAMFKKIVFIVTLLGLYVVSFAQDNGYVQEDSNSIIENVIAEPPAADEEEIKQHNGDFGAEVLGDTSIYFNDFNLSEDSIMHWKKDKKYAWIKNLDSLLRERENKVKKQTQEISRQGNNLSEGLSATERFFNSTFLKIILWALAACFVAFIIFRLFLSKGIFGKASKKVIAEVVQEEDDHNMDNDFHQLYKKAYAAGDIRLAMRYLFLKTLQTLNEKDLIRFALDKTNSIYVSELPLAKRNDFAGLALYYEYIWYGNFAVEKDAFDKIENKYNEFLNKV